ncbi:MAG: PBP1A family penicillin-binding protein [bacterium]|nr:PBP1A family penicillin-binding protein [bacterium]
MKPKKKKIIKIFGLTTLVVLVLAATGLIYLSSLIKNLPVLDQISDYQLAQSTQIYDRTGKVLLYEIHGQEKRTVIPFEEIPDYVKKATIAIEDHGFYNHPAFDLKAIVRALFNNLIHGQSKGASTITQQLAKNAFLSPEKTIQRKIKELALAIELERYYAKDEILTFYLNQIPYGSNIYGIEAAAQAYFGKPAKELDLAEAAVLAAAIQAPSYYSPWGSRLDELKKRQELVLDEMLKQGFIDAGQKEQAIKTKLVFASPSLSGIKAPHFVMEVKEYLVNRYGEEMVQKGGLKVITTLNYELQKSAETAVTEGAQRNDTLYKGKNAALVAQDAKTGQILALVGSRNYYDIENEGNFNVATQGLRQPGSALKPFVYLTAFERGYTPDTILFDVPTEFTANNPLCPAIVDFNNENPVCFHPRNFDKQFRGPVDLKNALAQSINIPAVKMLYLSGLDNVVKTLHNFGITTLTDPRRYGLSLVLGGGEVKLIDLVEAYSVLSQEGIKHPQTIILEVKDSNGKILEEYQDRSTKIVDPLYPQLINNILSDKDLRQPLFSSSLNLTVFPDQEVALKTGTSNNFHDAWALGYTPSFVVGVWAGNNNNAPMQQQAGSILAAVPIWHAFMEEILKNATTTETFTRPYSISAEKPILRGEAVINYQVNGVEYPQIHDILYYIDKNNPQGPIPQNPQDDPQFQNWEEELMEWLKQNLPDFSRYNQTPPGLTQNSNTGQNSKLEIAAFSPNNGDFVKDAINIKATIKSDVNLDKIELYFNNQLIDRKSPGSLGVYEYQYQIANQKFDLQNSLKIKVSDVYGNSAEKEVIVFQLL